MVRPNYSMNKKEKNAFGLTDRDIKTLQDIFKKHPELKNHIDRVGLPFYEKLVGGGTDACNGRP